MRVTLASLRGAPGVTTAALGIGLTTARAGHPLTLVEADPAGGALAARLNVAVAPGMVEFATTRTPDEEGGHTIVRQIEAGLAVLLTPPGGPQAEAALRAALPHLDVLSDDKLAIIDIGRLWPGSPSLPLWESADIAVLVVRPVLSELGCLLGHLPDLRERPMPHVLLLAEPPARNVERRYDASEVTDVIGQELPILGTLPYDPVGLRLLYEGRRSRWWERSRLANELRHVAARLRAESMETVLDLTQIGAPAWAQN